ncbi:hypothetical protein EJ05DRAFT_498604 [Pseudovirgaria hyperparasitica]|uniref:Rhodopsin domain-containing protein n=1 Tax=Pseudovirgaria hyperparasitica TaxID=470096 RepID=A0A6A6WHM4_9PEZI|nr:uncharacterized protein EJ05DRAFT_498604 [Pseudovirgaria hyperparasitica]KAF2760651.1 hypothetical protein EJ05DRAFT_498604 [Pseudovirgaria hyperparasitica]
MSDPDDKTVVIASIALTAVSFVFISLRLYTRFFVARDAGVAEAFIAIAMGSNVSMCVLIVKVSILSFENDRTYNLDRTRILKLLWAGIISYNLGVGTVKISILLQYLRIFATTSFRIISWLILVITSTFIFWSVFSTIFNCHPITDFWREVPPAGACLNTSEVWLANSIVNLALNLTILILPITDFFRMRTLKRQKALLMLLFGLGLSIIIISAVRLHYTLSTTRATLNTNTTLPLTSTLELSLGIILSSTLSLRSLTIRFFPDLFGPPSCPSPVPSHISNYLSHFPGRHDRESHYYHHNPHYYNDSLSELARPPGRDVELLAEAKITACATAE